jgi:Protein of unknown function (DUF1116)
MTPKSAVSQADSDAGELMQAIEPVWAGVVRSSDVVAADRLLLHAGPPFRDWDHVPTPVRNSLTIAAVFEGWASTVEDAGRLLSGGVISLGSAQDHDIVVPLAGVVSPSMFLHVVADVGTGRRKYSTLNEGVQHCLRSGTLNLQIADFHRWLNGPYAAWLAARTDQPIPLLPLLAQSLALGDDGHSRTWAGSALFDKLLINSRTPPAIAEFQTDCIPFALNLWMGAAALILAAAEGTESSGIITRAGGNGHDFGIQIASDTRRWRTIAAEPPRGPIDPAHAGHGAVPALGDSAILDMLGLGGQSLDCAPIVCATLANYLPEDARDRPDRLLPLCLPTAGGLRTGLSTRAVNDYGVGPIVLMGMVSDTGRGRIGSGVYHPPMSLFQSGPDG